MAVTETTFSVSVTNAETTLIDITTEGVYVAFLDLTNLAAGDVFQFWAEADVHNDGSDEYTGWPFVKRDAQSPGLHWQYPEPIIVKHGTLLRGQRLSGSNRTVLGHVLRLSSGS